MKKSILLLIMLVLILVITGCSAGANDVTTEIELLSSADYPMDRALINIFKDTNFDVNIESWEFITEDTIYILTTDGRELIADKENVTLFSSKK